MPPQLASFTPYRTLPYLTREEYRAGATGVDTSALVPSGTPADQDAALDAKIRGGSALADAICDQILAATIDTEARRVRATRDGEIIIHPDNWPVIEVLDVQLGPTPDTLTALQTLSGVWVEPQQFIITNPTPLTSAGPLQLGGLMPGGRLFCRYTYVNGWPNTRLVAVANAGSNQLTVEEPAGIVADTRLLVDVGATQEPVVVADPAGQVVTLQANLTQGHAAGAVATALPDAAKQATILLTSVLIRTRGSEAIVLDSIDAPGPVQGMDPRIKGDLDLAKIMLSTFARRR